MCANAGITDGIILTALSVIKYTNEKINLFIATMDLTDVDARYLPVGEDEAELIESVLKRKNRESTVRVIDMTNSYRDELMGGKNEQSRYTPYAMLRLLADLYPFPDKLLYLDCDVLALSDVSELYNVDASDVHVAGVRDYYGRWFIGPRYMNSGVMLWNLKKMRDDGVLKRARKICTEKRMLLPDQTAINRCAQKKLLPRKYNDQHGPHRDTVINHFSMRIRWLPFRTENIKPWQVDRLHGVLGIHCHDDVIEQWRELRKEKLTL